jgi:hypothetical protein
MKSINLNNYISISMPKCLPKEYYFNIRRFIINIFF